MIVAPIRVVIADNRNSTRRGVKALLAFEPRIELIGEASDGAEAVRLVEEKKPDLVLMDVHMPVMDGIEATRRIRAACQRIKVVVYTMYPDSEREAVLAGADIFLLKGSPDADPIRAILSLFPSRDFTP